MSIERYRDLFAYEREAHQRVLAALGALPEDAKAGSAFQHAVDLLAHIVAARRMWLVRMGASGERLRLEDLEPRSVSLAELAARLAAAEQAWTEYLSQLDDAGLAATIEYKSYDSGSFRNTVEEILTQLYGHSLYHRGQIALLIRQAGGQPVSTDYIFWARQPL